MAKKSRKWLWILWLLLLAGLVLAWLALERSQKQNASSAEELYIEVQEGPLVINLLESGTIKPREQLIIKSEVEGRSTILSLIPEGTRVSKGDLLVELDASSAQDNKVNQEITVQNANASFVESSENLEVVKNQAKADTDLAELNLKFAIEDLRKYKEGEYPKTVKEYQGKIFLAEEELQQAQDELKWSETLYQEKYLSETELRSDQLACQRCELALQTAKANLELLENYTYKRQIDELESDVSQSQMALERIRRSTRAKVVQAEAQLLARELELNRQKQRLEKFIRQIQLSKIFAPADGLVIYATSARSDWRRNTAPLAEGQEVHERQELIYLPTANTFVAEVKLHETNLKKTYLNLPVRLRVDALPGQIFTGKISRIAPLPDPHSIFMNPDLKVYNTLVTLEGDTTGLKSGMNCEAEIIVEQHDKAMYIPVQSVLRASGTPIVFVQSAQGPAVKREVQIGQDNNRMVHILGGLKTGEKVLLAPPLQEAVSMRSQDEVLEVSIPARQEVAEPAPDKPANSEDNSSENSGENSGGRGRRQRPNLTPEQRQQLQERMANMSEEERAAMRQRRQRRPEGVPTASQTPAQEPAPGK
ncbi:MAG: HlyD family efflux transporter periplasmic adaptor subunit [Oligosphaeraceae bacterium]|nr:HlyD family efflux transporter periplasmic adaptor subunit [Oligosphaeraceae bacterium]